MRLAWKLAILGVVSVASLSTLLLRGGHIFWPSNGIDWALWMLSLPLLLLAYLAVEVLGDTVGGFAGCPFRRAWNALPSRARPAVVVVLGCAVLAAPFVYVHFVALR